MSRRATKIWLYSRTSIFFEMGSFPKISKNQGSTIFGGVARLLGASGKPIKKKKEKRVLMSRNWFIQCKLPFSCRKMRNFYLILVKKKRRAKKKSQDSNCRPKFSNLAPNEATAPGDCGGLWMLHRRRYSLKCNRMQLNSHSLTQFEMDDKHIWHQRLGSLTSKRPTKMLTSLVYLWWTQSKRISGIASKRIHSCCLLAPRIGTNRYWHLEMKFD